MVRAITKLLVTLTLLCQIAEFTRPYSILTLFKCMDLVCHPLNNTSNVAFIQIRKQGKNLTDTDVVATAHWEYARPSDIMKQAQEVVVEVNGSVRDGYLRVTMTEPSDAGNLYGIYNCLYISKEWRESIFYNITVTAETTGTMKSGGFRLNMQHKASLHTQGFTTLPFPVDFVRDNPYKDQQEETHLNPGLECDKGGKECFLTGLHVSDSLTLSFTCSRKSADTPGSYNCTEQNIAAADTSDIFWPAVSSVISAVVFLSIGMVIDALLCKYCKNHPLHSSKRTDSKIDKTDKNTLSEVKVDPAKSKNKSTPEEHEEDDTENGSKAITGVMMRGFNGNKYHAVSKPPRT